MSEQEKQITIEDLELSLEIYELQSQQKLKKLEQLFQAKGAIDPSKMFYEDRSSLQIKFQNIISDLIQFLVSQQVPTTQKLRKVFNNILQNPLLLLFKVSRFEIFDLKLNGFDIQLQPIQAIGQLGASLIKNMDEYLQLDSKLEKKKSGVREYGSYNQFLREARLNSIQQKIFILYSYLRKGASILKKKFENKLKIVEIFNTIQQKLLNILIKNEDWKTLKELSILNYEIYMLQGTFDVLNFYLRIPLRAGTQEIFKQVQILAEKCKINSNYDIFILALVRYNKQIIQKLQTEKIDEIFYPYIENTLITILEIWGCMLCHYKQFCKLFEQLLKAYSPQYKIIQLCLKHTPKLQKDDITLMRTNFKLQLHNKHEQLLSLLTSQTFEETNNFLSTVYHRNFYSLSFRTLPNDVIQSLLKLLNGSDSLQEFFKILQRAFKQWNHTIDFAHSHKFIQSQFKIPQITQQRIEQSLNLIKNFCILYDKNFSKDFQNLIKNNTIVRCIFGLIKYISTSKECSNYLDHQQLILESLQFLLKTNKNQIDVQELVNLYSKISFKTKQRQAELTNLIIAYIKKSVQFFHIPVLVEAFKNLSTNLQQQLSTECIQLFVQDIKQMNERIKLFAFFELNVDDLKQQKITKQEFQFLKKQAIIKNGIIEAKNNAIFKISDLELVTNPIQFEKIMDNYYFTLQSNIKKFLQYLLTSQISNDFHIKCLKNIITNYPICVPLISSTRIQLKQKSSVRFVEFLCEIIGQQSFAKQILIKICSCNCIHYKNGKNYIKQQIIPMIINKIIKIVNELNKQSKQSIKTQTFEILVELLQNSITQNIKLDIFQKSIQKLNYLLSTSNQASTINILGCCHFKLLKGFFKKKQIQMRRQKLSVQYPKLIWNDVRQYAIKSVGNSKVFDNIQIVDHTIVSPYSLSKDFNIQEYKIVQSKQCKILHSTETFEFEKVYQSIEKVSQQKIMNKPTNITQKTRVIDLSKLNFNLKYHLGDQIIEGLQKKQKIHIIQCQKDKEDIQSVSEDQNLTLIQYYLKELQQPQINQNVILQCIYHMCKGQTAISYVWSNCKNFSRLFINLITIFQYLGGKQLKQGSQSTVEDKILKVCHDDQLNVQKRILTILKQLGYSDIWGQTHATVQQPLIAKHTGLAFNKQQAFLNTLLKIALENENLKQQLDRFLQNLFKTRLLNQNALMYKVSIDRNLLNIIMKSLQIKHLSELSLIIHSNFNNLRLYTDQLHQGLKALNMASKNRSYNEFIQLSKQYEDDEFFGPMKLFKQNMDFFIRIEKDGYLFKKNQQIKLTVQRLANVLRKQQDQIKIQQISKIMDDYFQELQKLQLNIANRIKSFYLVTKLRDLSYQNSLTITIFHSVLKQQHHYDTDKILQQLDKIQIFSLLNSLFNELIILDNDWLGTWKYKNYHSIDKQAINRDLTICTTRRFSHSMSKTYEQVDLQFDQIIQRCFDVMKEFFSTTVGKVWIQKKNIYPPFLIRSFIGDQKKGVKLRQQIRSCLNSETKNELLNQIDVKNDNFIQDLIKGFRTIKKTAFYSRDITIKYENKSFKIEQFLPILMQHLLKSEAFVQTKQDQPYILFNKYKTSQVTLQQIEAVGYIVAFCIYHKISIKLPFHPSIVAAIAFNISNIDHLINIDFKTWQDMKNILSVVDSKTLNLNFSYNFESLQTLQVQRIQLIDKGSSKKVNNLNRQQFVDSVCFHLLYKNYNSTLTRLLQTILYIIPKQYICCIPISQVFSIFYSNNTKQLLIKELMKKVGLCLPDVIFCKGSKIDNLKDYQNITWFEEIMLENSELRRKIWPDETNIFVVTTIGGKGQIQIDGKTVIIHHFNSKEEMKKSLA